MKKKKKINTRNIKILACVLLVGFVLVFGIQFWLSSTGSASDQSQSGSGSTEEPDQSTTVHTELTEDQKKDRKVQELLKDMTLDQKIGQLFLARVPESGAVAELGTGRISDLRQRCGRRNDRKLSGKDRVVAECVGSPDACRVG